MKNYLHKLILLFLSCIALIYLRSYVFKQFNGTVNTFLLQLLIGFVVSAILAAVIKPTEMLLRIGNGFIRYFLAYVFIFYALGKIFNLQFIIDATILAKKAGELDGLSKAWLFFGHSFTYGLFIAIAEIAAALLLLFKRTATTGALLYFFIMANITVMDFLYGVESMQTAALIFTLMSSYLILVDGKRVWQFVTHQPFVLLNEKVQLSKWWHTGAAILFIAAVSNDVLFFAKIKMQMG